MALLMDQSRLVLSFWSAEAREVRELRREKLYTAPWTFPFKLGRTRFFWLARPKKWKTTLDPRYRVSERRRASDKEENALNYN